MNERDRSGILRIIEYCTRIEAACQRFGMSFSSFENDPDYRDVICMNIFQIGEISNQVSDELKNSVRDVPWDQMYGIRNVLAHAYIKLDNRIVWQTVEKDITKLKVRLEELV